MSLYSKKKSTSSSRLHCLLLKTLLFLLCIYIKRVTAAHIKSSTTTQTEKSNDNSISPLKLTKEGATSNTILNFMYKSADIKESPYEIACPIDQLIKKYNPTKVSRSLRKNIIEKATAVWYKDDQLFRRENGNHVEFGHGHDTKKLILYSIGPSDGGKYTCKVNYSQIPKEAYIYYTLDAGASFDLVIEEKAHLPDMKGTINSHPFNKIVKRHHNTSFDCKSIEVLLSPTTYWVRCLYKDKTCMKTFINDYNNANERKEVSIMLKYVIQDYSAEILPVNNVTEDNIGYYGCWVENDKGFDLRIATLELMEELSTTIAPTTTAPTTTAPTSIAYTTIAPLNIETTPKTQISNNTDKKTNVARVVPVTASNQKEYIGTTILVIVLALIMIIIGVYLIARYFIYNGKKKSDNLMSAPIVGSNLRDENIRQHLPNGNCPDIYNIGKSKSGNLVNGFITGRLSHSDGQLLTQSISNQVIDDKVKTATIRSNHSNLDVSSSWGKKSTLCSNHGETSRAFYQHTSATTTTTVPMYDHPPTSTLGGRLAQQNYLCEAIIQDACVINPTYGFIPLDIDRQINDSDDWYFPRRNLERLNKIGEGQFGEVWRYIARQNDGKESFVAVKQLKNRVGVGARERLELIAEIEIMKSLNDHPNVIELLHYCVDNDGPILLIMEYAENGKLQTYLRNCRNIIKTTFNYGSFSCETSNYADVHSSSGCSSANSSSCGTIRQPNITSKELIKFSYHVAKGMEYVGSKGIIHRDLASRNILVSKDKTCKVADFGFARRISDDSPYERTTANPVPVKWMAPEALVENKFTSKSDVFSFGILMWEIVTLGATPYECLNSSEVYKKVTSGDRLEKPAHCKEEFFSIMSKCWSHNPSDRPTFKELVSQLEQLLLSENNYIELDQYPEHAYYNILSNNTEKEIIQNII